MNNGVLQSSSLVQPAMAIPGNPNLWWNVNGIPSPPALQLGGSIPSSLSPAPASSSNSSSSSWQEMNNSHNLELWSQLLFGGLIVEGQRNSDNIMRHFQAQQSRNDAFSTDHIKQEHPSIGRYISIYGHANDCEQSFQLRSAASQPTWSPMAHVSSSNISETTSIEADSVLHYFKKDRGTQRPTRDRAIECNSNANGGAQKKARVQPSPAQSTFKARKEKLGDRITVLHQMVSPFGKTDTASVLLEAIGYIRFLHNQIEALSLPYLERDDSSEEGMKLKGMGLRNRGLCLVPIPCTLGVGYENSNVGGADHWPAANSFEGGINFP